MDLTARQRVCSLRITCRGVLWHRLVASDHFLKVVLCEKNIFVFTFVCICVLCKGELCTHLPSSLSILAHSNDRLVVEPLPVVGRREHILDLVFEVLMKTQSLSWSPMEILHHDQGIHHDHCLHQAEHYDNELIGPGGNSSRGRR